MTSITDFLMKRAKVVVVGRTVVWSTALVAMGRRS